MAPRKAQVVDAAEAGRLTPETACWAYRLSPEELAAWKRALDRYGVEGLKLARWQGFRSAGTAAAAGAHWRRGQEPGNARPTGAVRQHGRTPGRTS